YFPKDGFDALHAPPGGPIQVRVGLFAAGRKNVGVLLKLKNSPRNWSLNRSVKLRFLKMETSAFFGPGPLATRRARFPNSWIAAPGTLGVVPGTLNAAGLKYPSALQLLSTMDGPEIRSATLKVLKTGGRTLVRMSVGKPPRSVKMPFTSHPAITFPIG